MLDNKKNSPFDFLVFNPLHQGESQSERFRSAKANSSRSSSSSLSESDSDHSPPPPESEGNNNNLSSVLTRISIPKNPLSEIGDPSEGRLLKITNSPTVGALTELRLSGKGLSHFESSQKLLLSRLFNLSILDLSNNYLTEIQDISQCLGLTYLNLSNNMIVNITPLGSLAKLVTVKLSFNKVESIEPLAPCDKLQKLKLDNNHLPSFPKALQVLKSLPSLRHLTLFSNPCTNKTKDAFKKLSVSLKLLTLDKKVLESNPLQRVNEYCKILKNESSEQEGVVKEKEELKEQKKPLKLLERLRAETGSQL